MRQNMENMIAERAKPNVSINLEFLGLVVPSGQESQQVGFWSGMMGAVGETGPNQERWEISSQGEEALRSELDRADLTIFGGQEASPDLDVVLPYEPKYIAYLMAKTPGLHVSRGKVLVEWGWAKSHSN
jgi:hypothetical protein